MSSQNTYLNWLKINSTSWIILHLLLILGISGFIVFWSTAQMWNYQPIEGVIVQSKMESCGGTGDGYYPVVKFSYLIGERTYVDGDLRRDFAKMCYSKQEVSEQLNRYLIGTVVQGWYDPDNPRIAIIDRSLGTIQWGFLIVAGGFATIFSLAALFARSNRIKLQTSKLRRNQQETPGDK